MSSSISTIAVPTTISPEAEARRVKLQSETESLRKSFSREQLRWDNVDWVVTIFMITVHLGCIAAPFYFSWTGLAVCAVMHWMTCSIGICLGYHRYLSHKSFKLRTPAEFFVLLIGSLSGEGSPMTWAATHRLHHHKSDHDGDPHSPLGAPWWGHILWIFVKRKDADQEILWRRYIPELVDRPIMKFFERTFPLWLWAQGLVLLGVGWAVAGPAFGISLLVWGMCVRMVLSYHSTWFVNSATHLWGYRNYDTRDQSRNLWWVALVAYGEGWHNNHHAHPSVAPAGHRWWEIDMTWWTIRALQLTGLAYDVKSKLPEGRKADIDPAEIAQREVTKELVA